MSAQLLEALRNLVEAAEPFGYRDDDPIQLAKDAARAAIEKATAPIVSRWRCPCCKSLNVQISLPTWYYETTAHDLDFVETDSDADISWWYCEDCSETDSGTPNDTLEDLEP